MVVYKITNTVNDKFYIGITTRSIKERLRNHKRKTNPYLQNAMKKYGKENFVIEQIDTATSDVELDEKERYYIKKLKPHYNMASGGRTGYKYTEEVKRKMSESHKGVPLSASHNKNRAESCKKTYKITFPDGTVEVIKGIKEFARKHKLGACYLIALANGRRKHYRQ